MSLEDRSNTAISNFCDKLLNPLDSLVRPCKWPDHAGFPTTSQHYTKTLRIMADANGDFDLVLLPHVFCSALWGNTPVSGVVVNTLSSVGPGAVPSESFTSSSGSFEVIAMCTEEDLRTNALYGRITAFGAEIKNTASFNTVQGNLILGTFPSPEFAFPVTAAGSTATWSNVLSYLGLPVSAAGTYVDVTLLNAGHSKELPSTELVHRPLKWHSSVNNLTAAKQYRNFRNMNTVTSSESLGLSVCSLGAAGTPSSYVVSSTVTAGSSAVSFAGTTVRVCNPDIGLADNACTGHTSNLSLPNVFYLKPWLDSEWGTTNLGGSEVTLGEVVCVTNNALGTTFQTYFATGPNAGLPAYFNNNSSGDPSYDLGVYVSHSPAFSSPTGLFLSSASIAAYFPGYRFGQVYVVLDSLTGVTQFNVSPSVTIPTGSTLSFFPQAESTNYVLDPNFLLTQGWDLLAIRGQEFTANPNTGIDVVVSMDVEIIPPLPSAGGISNSTVAVPTNSNVFLAAMDAVSHAEPMLLL